MDKKSKKKGIDILRERLRDNIPNVPIKLITPQEGYKKHDFIDHVFKFLCKLLNKIAKERKRVKFITLERHMIRSFLFDFEEIKATPENKFLLQAIILAVKLRGLLFKKVFSFCNQTQNAAKDVLYKSQRSQFLSQYQNEIQELLKKIEGAKIIREVPKKSQVYYIEDIASVIDGIKEVFNIEFNSEEEEKLKELLDGLTKAFDIDLSTENEVVTKLNFYNPKVIRNKFEMVDKTVKCIEDAKEIKCITETGEWITEYFRSHFEKMIKERVTIRLILADWNTPQELDNTMHPNRQAEVYKELLKIGIQKENIKWLDCRLHDEHFTIGLGEGEKENKGKGIYFMRRGKSSNVVMLSIENEEDIEKLNRIFEELWEEAKQDSQLIKRKIQKDIEV